MFHILTYIILHGLPCYLTINTTMSTPLAIDISAAGSFDNKVAGHDGVLQDPTSFEEDKFSYASALVVFLAISWISRIVQFAARVLLCVQVLYFGGETLVYSVRSSFANTANFNVLATLSL
ncbi:hypothetical protein V1519DRAFT_134178 [Lipomyces tetrasporus]